VRVFIGMSVCVVSVSDVLCNAQKKSHKIVRALSKDKVFGTLLWSGSILELELVFEDAHMDRVCVRVFIGTTVRAL
jgi:hypothetical protein